MIAMKRTVTTLLALAATVVAQTPVRVENTPELRAALAAAKPGAVIALAAGDYEGFSAANVAGTAQAPIVVRAADAAARPRFAGGIHLSDVAFVTLEDLLVERAPHNGINIDDGGTTDTPSHHVVLRGLVVRDIGSGGNHDGIKLSGVDDLRIESCTVERWGRGGSAIDMVGCHQVLIDACTLRDRDEGAAATGVQAKGGSRDVTVRRCRFEHAGERAVNIGGSTGMQYFRPKPEVFEAKDVTVEGCTFVGSMAPIAFVGCGGALVRFNTFYEPRKWVLRILQETRAPEFVPCRGGVFSDNLVVTRGLDASVNVGPGTAPETFVFARNWWFRADAPERSVPQLPAAERDAAGGRDPGFTNAARGDFTLRPDSPARAHGATAWSDKR
jgi:hypothetical protein